MNQNVIVVGGGIAGLTAAIYLARGGRNVTLFEKKQHLGGRAITHLRHGFRFNLGPHALYRAGVGAKVYRELGVPIRGGMPKRAGLAVINGERHKLPLGPFSIITTSLLRGKAKWEAVSLLLRLRNLDTKPFASMTLREWLDANVSDVRLRRVMETLFRVSTYSSDDQQSAASALDQLKLTMRGVVYVDEGWQKLVDALHSHAVTAGVNFVTSSRIVGVQFDDAVRAVEMGGLDLSPRNDTLSVAIPYVPPNSEKGTRLQAETILLAVDPMTARDLVGSAPFAQQWGSLTPVTAACLDLALSKLPRPEPTFALAIDRPLYMSVHSAYAQLTPRGGALIHVAKYRSEPATVTYDDYDGGTVHLNAEALRDEEELERFLDQLQPGWRELVVHRRFLPAMTVTNALVRPQIARPSPLTPIRGLYIAGDWVGNEGALADAALASARAAAKAILAS